MTEEWRPVEGWPYEVSSLGKVRRSTTKSGTRSGRVLRAKQNNKGYWQVDLYKGDGTHRMFSVHRLVAISFHGAPSNDSLVVTHLNGDCRDNRPENLQWNTIAVNNSEHRRLHGTMPFGLRHWRAFLSDDDVREIRRMRAAGVPLKEVAEKFAVSRSHASQIANRKIRIREANP